MLSPCCAAGVAGVASLLWELGGGAILRRAVGLSAGWMEMVRWARDGGGISIYSVGIASV
jgi:hypothetical protein